MERWHTSWLGLKQFPAEPSSFDLDQYFTVDAADQQIVASRRRSTHRLGIALQIGFIRMTGCGVVICSRHVGADRIFRRP